MERGKVAPFGRQVVYFVFDGLIATCQHQRQERTFLRLHQWSLAMDLWELEPKVCDWIFTVVGYGYPVDVITWHPQGFADLISEKLWANDVPINEVHATEYRLISHRFATDNEVRCVYDPDPAHRFGYGFKAREFSTSSANL
jgi:hypothetical protein